MLAKKSIGNVCLFDHSRKNIKEWPEIQDQLRSPLVLPVPIKLSLIRHAESTINAEKRITGSQDVELTPVGEQQAILLGEKLDNFYSLAFSSTLQRSQKTLEIAIKAGEIKIGKVCKDNRLNERSLGVLEGKKYQWIPEYAEGDLTYAPQHGESYEKVARRIFSFLLDVCLKTKEQSNIDSILISGHMGPMRILLGILQEEEDPATVLGLKFSNTEAIHLIWKQLQIPTFLDSVLHQQNVDVSGKFS